ncbi:glycine--tRNA ligase [Candidatus Uhrbacteria bacterium]|jgi:glycyl-tRNA synthetase|nr:glycine--tRNA ligase [Candidatus Uhrbacteria bacterium]
MKDVSMEKIVNLCKTRGFVFPGSEIYGGLANSWDYGPLGVQLKRNIKDDWWKTFVESRQDMVGLDGAILMNPKVWEASGHVETFNDPLVEDKETNKRYRADHLIEEVTGIDADGKSLEELEALIKEHDIKSPDGNELTAPRQFSGMFETSAGAAEEGKQKIYLRPETAQAIFVNFKNVLETSRKRLPFGIAQIGKAFRNEITPGNFIFRTLEFEQMEIEYFVEEAQWEEHFDKWEAARMAWGKSIGLDMDRVSGDDHAPEKLSHYSKKTVDVMFDFPFGRQELWGMAYRTDFDLHQHQEHSGQKLLYTDPNDNHRKFLPHVIEPSFGVDRTLLALLVSCYDEEEVDGDTRTLLRFPAHIAPVQVAVLPLSKKPELQQASERVLKIVSSKWRAEYDETQSIGKRYRRQDEIGTPYCITIDFDSLDDHAVTVRDRDTMKQDRVPIDELVAYFEGKF